MGAYRRYDDQTKAAAMAALLTGEPLRTVAGRYDVPLSTLQYWAKQARTLALEGDAGRLGDSLVAYLVEALEAATAAFVVTGDAEWLRKQRAAEVAVLHGTLVDRVMGMARTLNREGLIDG